MNDDLQTYIEPEMEARIVALVLGEASAFEAGELERLLAEKSELQTYKKRIEEIHGLVGEAYEECDDLEWQLSDERRRKVLAKIEEGKREYESLIAKQREKRQARQRLVYVCAACLLVSMILLVTMQLSKSSKNSEHLAMMAEAPPVSREKALAALDQEVMKQSDLVQENRKELTTLVQSYGIPYFDDGQSNPLGATEQSMFRDARGRLAEFEEEGEKLEKAITAEVTAGRSGADLEAKTAKLEGVKQQMEKLGEMVSTRKEDTIELSLKQNRYNQSKETYEQSRMMLRDMKVAQRGARAALGESESSEGPEEYAGYSNSRGQDVAGALASLDNYIPTSDFGSESLSVDGIVTAGLRSPSEPSGVSGLNTREPGLGVPMTGDLPVVGRLFRNAEKESAPEEERAGKRASTTATRKPLAPSSSQSRVIAANTASPSAIPVPEINMPSPSQDFGDGDDFGDGWGAGNVNGEILGKENLTVRERQRPDSINLGDALGTSGKLAGGGAAWEFELTDSTEQAKQGQNGRGLARAKSKKPSESPELFGLLPDIVTDSTDLPLTHRAGVNLGFDDSLERESGSNESRGGEVVDRVTSRNNRDFIGNVDRLNIPGIPASPQESVSNIVTAGLRSGAAAINRNSIDAILSNPTQTTRVNGVASENLSGTTTGELKKKVPKFQQPGNYFGWSADDDEKGSTEPSSSPGESTVNRERDSEGDMDSDGISASEEFEKLDPGRIMANGDSGGGGGGDIGGIDPFADGTASGGGASRSIKVISMPIHLRRMSRLLIRVGKLSLIIPRR
ncbi:MAG: guanyl-specific ribonuclease Sa [Akkermansiaceae bacterium]|jgi:guanyl-specific ribonuclease Sa